MAANVAEFFGSMMLRVGFDKVKDSDGMVGIEEVKELLQANLISLKHPFVVATLDETKEVEKYDYQSFYELYKTVKQNTADRSQADMLEVFKQYDVSDNGFITKEDLAHCLRVDEYYDEDELDTIIALVLKYGDVNHDGKLNYIEFLEMINDQGDIL